MHQCPHLLRTKGRPTCNYIRHDCLKLKNKLICFAYLYTVASDFKQERIWIMHERCLLFNSSVKVILHIQKLFIKNFNFNFWFNVLITVTRRNRKPYEYRKFPNSFLHNFLLLIVYVTNLHFCLLKCALLSIINII